MRCSKAILLSALLLTSNSAFSAITTVYPGGGLQAAIAAASEGDTILLESGIYTNADDFIDIGVSLTIKAASAAMSPIIQDGLEIVFSIDKLSIQGIQFDNLKRRNDVIINELEILESKLVSGDIKIQSPFKLGKFTMIASSISCYASPNLGGGLRIDAEDIILAGNNICRENNRPMSFRSPFQGKKSITVVGNTFTGRNTNPLLDISSSSEVLIAANRFIQQWETPGSITSLNQSLTYTFIFNQAIERLTVKNNIFTAQTDRLNIDAKLRGIQPIADLTNAYFENNLVDAGNIDIWVPSFGESEQDGMMQNGNDIPESITGNVFINYKDNILPLAATGLDFDTAQNNLCFNNGENCGITKDNLDIDPLLVDSIDYKLGAGSPAIDAGPVAAVLSDLDGSRNNIGPYGGSWSIDQYDAQRAPGAVGPYLYPIVDAAKGAANGNVKVKFISYGRQL